MCQIFVEDKEWWDLWSGGRVLERRQGKRKLNLAGLAPAPGNPLFGSPVGGRGYEKFRPVKRFFHFNGFAGAFVVAVIAALLALVVAVGS